LYRTAQELSEGLGHDGLHADTDQQQLPVLTKSLDKTSDFVVLPSSITAGGERPPLSGEVK
jgi:hypothetical protein